MFPFVLSIGPSIVIAGEPVALFDGQKLDGWQVVGDATWDVADGAIHTAGDKPGFLMTDRQYGDFEFTVEYRARPEVNSGIFLRTKLAPQDPTRDCYELNIAPADNPFPTGSLVGRKKAVAIRFPSAGLWRTLRLRAVGGRITVDYDGHRVLEYVDPHPIARGHIGLQSNQGEVWFHNPRIVELPATK